jgi:hypothetical protein
LDLEREIGDIRSTLRILEEKVGEITRSIRAYVDHETDRRVEAGLDEFQERVGQRLLGLQSRIEALEMHIKGKRQP